jgi:REP element-mobilizing transposase RayT
MLLSVFQHTDGEMGWTSRGRLPHYDADGVTQMITYRLADALPREAIEDCAPRLSDAESRARLDAQLDAGHGSCILRDAAAAEAVIENWRRFAALRYELHAWVVMPNHVHVLITVHQGWRVATIVQSWKSYTSKRIRRVVGGRGAVWQREYWDRAIRNERHFAAAVEYIHDNPVKAALVAAEAQWPWSSARERSE